MQFVLRRQPPHVRKMVKAFKEESCRYCECCKTGNDEEGKPALFCHLWKDRVCKVLPFDRCELFRKGQYDMLEFIVIKGGGVDG